MDIENSKAQMKKGALELCILGILRAKEMYPSDIIAIMKDENLLIVEGTLYPLLTRLKNEGLLTYRWVESSSGPPRKYFTLTEAGSSFFSQLLEAYQDLNNSITHILNK
jgi:PadR family transcriptional regulator PadR